MDTDRAKRVIKNVSKLFAEIFDIKGIVHKEFLPPGQTVNGKFSVRF
jgi:hypothetical protein